jgi:hypothetical protein
VKGRAVSPVLAALVIGLLQAGCGGSTSGEEQRVTDVVNAYQSAVLSGDGETACSYMTPAYQRKSAGHDQNGSPSAACAREVGFLHKDPGFIKLNKDVSVTGATVNGDKATVRIHSAHYATVGGQYGLVKSGDQWKIASFLGSS